MLNRYYSHRGMGRLFQTCDEDYDARLEILMSEIPQEDWQSDEEYFQLLEDEMVAEDTAWLDHLELSSVITANCSGVF